KGPPDTSTDFRRRWGGLIWSVGVDLGLDSVTTATAALYFQRFFLTEKEGVFDARRMAISSVWLASKVREGMCRLRDIVNSFESLTGRVEDEKGMSMEVYWALRDELVLHEQALLRAMAYDAELTPAYTFLTEFVWLLNSSPSEKSVIALAWTILNDAFCSEVCVMAAPDRQQQQQKQQQQQQKTTTETTTTTKNNNNNTNNNNNKQQARFGLLAVGRGNGPAGAGLS
ncbi:unnamed protein product, partial [Polarella glacialis]